MFNDFLNKLKYTQILNFLYNCNIWQQLFFFYKETASPWTIVTHYAAEKSTHWQHLSSPASDQEEQAHRWKCQMGGVLIYGKLSLFTQF